MALSLLGTQTVALSSGSPAALTIPVGTTTICIAASTRSAETSNTWALGGVAITNTPTVLNTAYDTIVGYLLDISARANDNLTTAAGNTQDCIVYYLSASTPLFDQFIVTTSTSPSHVFDGLGGGRRLFVVSAIQSHTLFSGDVALGGAYSGITPFAADGMVFEMGYILGGVGLGVTGTGTITGGAGTWYRMSSLAIYDDDPNITVEPDPIVIEVTVVAPTETVPNVIQTFPEPIEVVVTVPEPTITVRAPRQLPLVGRYLEMPGRVADPGGLATPFLGHDGIEPVWQELDDYATEAEVDTAIAVHTGDATDAHDASAISVVDASGFFVGTDVEAVLTEIATEADALAVVVNDHIAQDSNAHAASAISIVDAGNDFTAVNVEDALAELQADAEADATALSDHISDSSDAHDASAISIVDAGGDFTATDVEGALAELQADHEADATALSDHIADSADAHDASAISIVDTPNHFAATTVEAALEEAYDDFEAHLADTADAHDASAISILDSAAQYTATDVEAALAEVLDALQAHEADSSDAHDASAISVVDAAGHFAATEVEAALAEAYDDFEDHSARHVDGGADEILVEALPTAEVNTALRLAPDGAGGVSWEAGAGGIEDHDHSAPTTEGGILAASVITIADAGGDFTATDVEGALAELQADNEAHVAAADPHSGYRLESADHTHQSTGAQAGTLDHGLALTGLTDDDHTQYLLASGARDLAGNLNPDAAGTRLIGNATDYFLDVASSFFDGYLTGDASNYPALFFSKKNTAGAAVVDNDYLGGIEAWGWDGDSYEWDTGIYFVVDGTPGAGDVPTSIEFWVDEALAWTIANTGALVAASGSTADLALGGLTLPHAAIVSSVTGLAEIAVRDADQFVYIGDGAGGQKRLAFITDVTDHTGDATDAHDASAISILDAANDFTATDVEGALAELQADAEAHIAAADPHTGYRLESADHTHASTGAQAGQIAHSVLTGVTADQHHAQAHSINGADHTASGLTAGHVLRATAATTFAFGASARPVQQFYVASTTWSKPSDIKFVGIMAEVVGGGGGSGRSNGTGGGESACSGGGGAGGYARRWYDASALPSSCTVTVGGGGAGGSGSSAADGSNGDPSSFSGSGITTITGNGGVGGQGALTTGANATNNGGAGGTGSGGELNINGGNGGNGESVGGVRIYTGLGGASALAPTQTPGDNAAAAGVFPGGGAGGAANGGGQGIANGGAGGAGVVLVTEYYV